MTASHAAQPGPVASAAHLQQSFDDQRRRSTLIILAIGIIAAIAAVLIGLRLSGLLGASGKTPDGKVLQAQGQAPGNILTAQGNTGGPVLQKGAEIVVMPKEIEDWLKHLEECERRKVEISGDQAAEISVLMQKMSVLGAGMGLMDPYDQAMGSEGDLEPSTYAQGKILDLRPKWQELIAYFRSYPPPAECQPLASDFDRALSEIPGMMGDLGEVLNAAAAGPEEALKAVKKMQNMSYGNIDRYFGRADEKLGQICSKYNKHKWFNIKTDVLAGGMLGKGAFGP